MRQMNIMKNQIRFEIPRGTKPAKCRSCGEFIYWITTVSYKKMPVNKDGISHFATCPFADKHRKQRRKKK